MRETYIMRKTGKYLWKQIVAIILIIVMVMESCQIQNLSVLREVRAAQMQDTVIEEDKDDTVNNSEEEIVEEDKTKENVTEKTEVSNDDDSEKDSNVLLALDEEEIPDKPEIPDTVQILYDGMDIIQGDGGCNVAQKLTHDVTVKGNFTIYGDLYLNGYTLTVEGNLTQYGNCYLDGTLVVNGSSTWFSGNTELFGGGYVVEGNMEVTMNNREGGLVMHHDSDYLFVGGDFNLSYNHGLVSDITAGVFELGGSFIQNTVWDWYRKDSGTYYGNSFNMTGTSTLVLSGNQQQVIYLADQKSGFQNVEVSIQNRELTDNGSYDFGEQMVSFNWYCNYEAYESHGCPTNYGYMVLEPETLTADKDIYGNAYLKEGTLKLNGYTLNVQGDLIQNGDLDLDNGSLYVLGDYRVQSVTSTDGGKEYGDSSGLISSVQACDVNIRGSFYTQSVVDHTGYLTGGSWELGSGLYQFGKNRKNFVTADSWSLMFKDNYSETKEHHISMDNPLENPIECITRITIEGNIVVDQGIYVKNYDSTQHVSGTFYIDNNNKNILKRYFIPYDVVIMESMEHDTAVEYQGNVTLLADYTINGGYFSCEKDVIVKDGVFYNNGGDVHTGNLIFPDDSEGTIVMTGGQLYCEDFYMGSRCKSGEMSNGKIYISGNLTQKNNGTPDNFVTTDSLEVHLDSDGNIIKVHFDSMESELCDVYTSSKNGGWVWFQTEVNIQNLHAGPGSLVEDGMQVGYTLESDVTYEETVQFFGETLDLNGHTMTVEKDFILSGGDVVFNGGTLIVKGDLRQQKIYEEDGETVYEKSYACMTMNQPEDSLIVSGDWFINGTLQLGDGEVQIAGNIISSLSQNWYDKNVNQGITLCLNGQKEQTVTGSTIDVKDLNIENPVKVMVGAVCKITGVLTKNPECKAEYTSLYIRKLTNISESEIIAEEIYMTGEDELTEDVTVHGKLMVNDCLKMGGNQLTADSISVYNNAEIWLQKGSITAEELYMAGSVYMSDDAEEMHLGTWTVAGKRGEESIMTAGTVYIREGYIDSTSSTSGTGFCPSGTHTVIFDKEQASSANRTSIRFDNVNSKLNIVKLRNLLNTYSCNREWEEIGNQVIVDYEDAENPEKPENLRVVSSGCHYVSLAWDASADNVEIAMYKIYRNGKYLAKTSKTYYYDLNLSADTTYRYSVEAYDGKNNKSALSEELLAVTNGDDTPPTVVGVPKIEGSDEDVSINFTNCFKDEDSYIDFYIITRDGEELERVDADASFTYSTITGDTSTYKVHSGVSSYTDKAIEVNSTYQYGIQAVDANGNVSKMCKMNAVTYALPDAPKDFSIYTEKSACYISFQKTGKPDCTKYKIYRKVKGGSYSCVSTITNDKEGLDYCIDRSVTDGYKYSYYVTALNRYGISGESTSTKSCTIKNSGEAPEIDKVTYTPDNDTLYDRINFTVDASDLGLMKSIKAYYECEEEDKHIFLSADSEEYKGENGTASFDWDTNSLRGVYTLHILAMDYAGMSAEVTRTFHINEEKILPVIMTEAEVDVTTATLTWESVEDAEYYKIEQLQDGEYKEYSRVRTPKVIVRGLSPETAYQFRICAYDLNGIVGRTEKDVEITTKKDILPPDIVSVYSENIVLSENQCLTVMIQDNVNVADVEVKYRKAGEAEWIPIKVSDSKRESDMFFLYWNTEGLESGVYELCYQARDTSGNESEAVMRTHQADFEGPLIRNFQLTPKDWQIQVSWSEFVDDDYYAYELFRRSEDGRECKVASGYGTRSFIEMISPEEKYTYILYAYDRLGNVSTAEVTGCSIDNDVFAPETCVIPDQFTVQGTPVKLSAEGCTDNAGIVSYQWDMGNGDIIYGKNCEYTYQEVGDYLVTLTVADEKGNQATQKLSVMAAKENIGKVHVTVTGEGKALQGAEVLACINGKPYRCGSASKTSNKGELSMMLPEGTYQIAVCKTNYTATEKTITVSAGKEINVNVDMKKGQNIETKCTVKEMTLEEIQEAGIDTTASQNKKVYSYTVNIIMEQKEIDQVTFNSVDGYARKTISVSCEGAGGVESVEKHTVDICNVSDDPENPVITVVETVPVNIGWLKNMYEVNFSIQNLASESFVFENAEAEISLPEGLLLASMADGKDNTPNKEFGDLKSGEQMAKSWYVAVDQSGYYNLQFQVEGTLQPFGKQITHKVPVSAHFEAKTGRGMHLYIYPENTAYIGGDYYIQYKLVNESTDDYYYVTTSFGAYQDVKAAAQVIIMKRGDGDDYQMETLTVDTGVSYYVKDTGKKEVDATLMPGDRLLVENFPSGGVLYGTTRFTFDEEGNRFKDYYELIDAYVEEMSEHNDMEITVEPIRGHINKQVVKWKWSGKKHTSSKEEGNKFKDVEPIEDNQPSTQDSVEETKDPINLMTGAFTIQHTVAAVAGAENITFDLFYDSTQTENSGELGKGWYHNYEMSVERQGSFVVLRQSPNESMYFAETEDTECMLCGTMEDGVIYLEDDSSIERTYYPTGTEEKQYRIVKSAKGYVLYAGQECYTFGKDGQLTGHTTADGKRTTITRTEEKLTITDEATGKYITALYDENERIIEVMDMAGGKTKLYYTNDHIWRMDSKTGAVLIYKYDDAGHIIQGTTDGKAYVENTYDEQGRVLTQIANGKTEELTSFSYQVDEQSDTTSVTMTNSDGTEEKAVSDRYGQGLYYKNAIGGEKKYTYNEYHEMTSYRLDDGTGADYTYDKNGNLTKIKETTGKTTSYVYDGHNRVVRMSCNDGTDVSYTYNEHGQIETIKSGTGITAQYSYNEFGQILTEESGLGSIRYQYEDGMLRCITDYAGNSQYLSYDDNGNVIQHIDGNGVRTDYELDASGRVLSERVEMEDGSSAVTSYTYDSFGKTLTKTDAKDNTTRYAYDEEDRLSVETRPDGNSIKYQYDMNGNITKITYPDGTTTASAVYDAAGNAKELTDTLQGVSKGTYNTGGQLLSLMQPNGGTIRYTYYDNGLLESQTDANGNITNLVYDEAGRISRVTDGSGAVTTFGYDKDGNLETVEDALGNLTKLVYNQYRKVISQTDASGNVTKYDYDSALNCIRVTDAEGGVTEFSYDARGQILSLTKKGDTKEQDVTLSMTYDNLGNVTSLTDGEGNTSRMEYDLNSRLTAVYDAKGVRIQKYEYDCLGNCIRKTDALGNVTGSSYDDMGNLVKQMNEATGNAVSYSYIGGQYLASSTDAFGNTASATYDSSGNIATLTNPNGGVTSYRYDLNNNLTDESIGTDYHVRYTYNAKNLVDARVNSRDQETVYEYDALGRLTKQTDEAGVIDYTYDANGNVLTVTETTGAVVNTITRTYDGLNRVTSYTDAKGNTIGYEYDRIGNLAKLTYPNGKAVTYTYDKNCSIKTVTDWNSRTTTYSYDSNGRLVKTERPDGTVETRTYDKAGNLTRILDKCGSTVVNQQEYTYDASGNITEVKQLYDGDLDFTGVTAASMTYDENNRLLTYNGETVQYDKDGNMTYGPLQGKMTEFVFDCRNRLVKAGDTSYEYDAENHRVAVITGSKWTEYVVDSRPELSQVLQSKTYELENPTSEGKETYFFYGNGLLSQDNAQGYLTYHFNNVGSTMTVTDAKGKVTETYNYTPYGELIDGTYSDNIPFLYNGQYGVTTDANGLYYMRARYYNVDIKRFINQDVLTGTLERISSLNRYAYVEGNPVSYLDPFGLERWAHEEAHKIAAYLSYWCSIISALVPPNISIGLFVVATGFDLGIYISEMVEYGIDFDVIYRMVDGLAVNIMMFALSFIKVSLPVEIYEKIAALIKAGIDMDKFKNPESYEY